MRYNLQPQPQQPSWLMNLLQSNFYEYCSIENHTKKTIFCLNCHNGAICEVCAIQHHQNHQTLRVFKASYEVSIRVEDLKRHIDDRGIQPFIINARSVFFLHSKTKSSATNTPKCEVCGGHIKSAPYQYCSIACKAGFQINQFHIDQSENYEENLVSIDGQDQGANSGESNPVVLSNGHSQGQGQVASSSLRKRKRKGIPHRSPLK